MKRVASVIAALALLAPTSTAAADNVDKSDNVDLLYQFQYEGVNDYFSAGTDLAFWRNLAVVGQFDEPGGFYLLSIANPRNPRLLSHFECPGPQNDVSIWRNLVFLSVDNAREHTECGAGDASRAQILTGDDWSGIRIVDISDRRNPEQIHTVRTDCGSHTHTLVPDLDNDRVLIYVQSYPLRDQGPNCGADGHGKISGVEVPLGDPTAAEVVSEPDVSPAVGCHDVTVFLETSLAAAACITESQIWDISDPAHPEIISHIRNPAMNIHHSSIFSWDGEVVVLGDEMGGAVAAAGCMDGGHLPLGALWFYDISDPEAPQLQSFWKIPEQEVSVMCTAHQFNAVPLRSDKRILVTSWFNGGTHVLDFTDPQNVERIGHYIPREGARANPWSAYWYNGFIFASNFDEAFTPRGDVSRGLDVFEIDHPDLRDHIRLPHLNPYTQEPLRRPGRG
jgi:hypothetical protein